MAIEISVYCKCCGCKVASTYSHHESMRSYREQQASNLADSKNLREGEFFVVETTLAGPGPKGLKPNDWRSLS